MNREQTQQNRERSDRGRFRRYMHVRVDIEFGEKPTLGWIQNDGDSIRRFPRDQHGNVFFDCKYWRGMIAQGLHVLLPEVLEEHPTFMQHLYVRDRAFITPLETVREFGKEYEQLPRGTQVATNMRFPKDVFDRAEFERFLSCCGAEIGWAPVHSADGFGRFRVLQVHEIEALAR